MAQAPAATNQATTTTTNTETNGAGQKREAKPPTAIEAITSCRRRIASACSRSSTRAASRARCVAKIADTQITKHRYRQKRGKPAVCLRCGVKRRSAKDRNGRWRRAIDKRTGHWQYQAPCQRDTWQHARLPCAIVCAPGTVAVAPEEKEH